MAPPPEAQLQRNFKMGLLAHLIIVPAWLVAPFMLLGSCAVTGAFHGTLGLLGSMTCFGGFVASRNLWQRVPLCLALVAMGVTVPPGQRRVLATAAAGLASFLAWLCKGGKGPFGRRAGLRRFINQWCKHYYQEADLRGALNDVRKDKTCFAFHPHGCLCAGWTINGTFNPKFSEHAGRVWWLCDFNLRYKNPTFRWLCDATETKEDGGVDAVDKKTILRLMERGENFCLIPGGFQDAVAYKFGHDCTVLKRRKGFIKYCLQFGYRLHPVYTFGESETYYAFSGLRKIRMKFSEQNIPMIAPFGWFLLPFLPRPQSRILTYVGPAMELPHIPEPTTEDVNKWHQKYMDALVKLFMDKRAEAGFPDATLEVA